MKNRQRKSPSERSLKAAVLWAIVILAITNFNLLGCLIAGWVLVGPVYRALTRAGW